MVVKLNCYNTYDLLNLCKGTTGNEAEEEDPDAGPDADDVVAAATTGFAAPSVAGGRGAGVACLLSSSSVVGANLVIPMLDLFSNGGINGWSQLVKLSRTCAMSSSLFETLFACFVGSTMTVKQRRLFRLIIFVSHVSII